MVTEKGGTVGNALSSYRGERIATYGGTGDGVECVGDFEKKASVQLRDTSPVKSSGTEVRAGGKMWPTFRGSSEKKRDGGEKWVRCPP